MQRQKPVGRIPVSRSALPLISTRLQPGVRGVRERETVSTVSRKLCLKPLKRLDALTPLLTRLKPGANKIGSPSKHVAYKMFRLIGFAGEAGQFPFRRPGTCAMVVKMLNSAPMPNEAQE